METITELTEEELNKKSNRFWKIIENKLTNLKCDIVGCKGYLTRSVQTDGRLREVYYSCNLCVYGRRDFGDEIRR